MDDNQQEVTPQAEAVQALNAAIDTSNADFVRALNAELGRDIEERDAPKPNRRQRRADVRRMKRLAIPLDAGVKLMYHPLLQGYLMPYGAKALARRRAAAKVARRARQVNRGGGKRLNTFTAKRNLPQPKARPEVQGS